jgi:hypothetical protein
LDDFGSTSNCDCRVGSLIWASADSAAMLALCSLGDSAKTFGAGSGGAGFGTTTAGLFFGTFEGGLGEGLEDRLANGLAGLR